MKTLHVALLAALLSTSSAYADVPHWTAAIGAGQASRSTSKSASPAALTNLTGVTTSSHWSASIGTGRAIDASNSYAAKSSSGGSPTASVHWTSRLGTGLASESNARAESSAVTTARGRP
jgi:hypothetical protein